MNISGRAVDHWPIINCDKNFLDRVAFGALSIPHETLHHEVNNLALLCTNRQMIGAKMCSLEITD